MGTEGFDAPIIDLVRRRYRLEEINTALDLLDRGEVARSIIDYR